MLEKLPLYKTIVLIFVFLLQGCASDLNEAPSSESVSCGDLMSIYAEKSEKLIFENCSNGVDQTLVQAIYFASTENADEIENFLVEKYGLVSRKNYYHSMPLNRVFLDPPNLLKIDPFYALSIEINLKNNPLKNVNNRELDDVGFWVTVKVLEI